MRDYYRILGVRPDATRDEIKEAWLFSVKAFHPDKFARSSQRQHAAAQERTKAINEAYEFLSDPKKRASYDREYAKEPRAHSDAQPPPRPTPPPPRTPQPTPAWQRGIQTTVGKFFPATLTRGQYLFRCMIVLIMFLSAFAVVELLVFGTTDANLQGIAGILFLVAALLAFLYNIFGLSIPRLKSAQISPSWVLLVFIPLGGALALFAICAIARQKPDLKA